MLANNHVLTILQERGFIAQITHAEPLAAALSKESVSFYTGYDPTADSLHVGHLLTLMAMRHLANAGHHPIVLLGGGTAIIGDPSGKTQARQLLAVNTLNTFATALKIQLQHFFRDSTAATLFVNNDDWLNQLSAYDLLREIGVHFSVNKMLTAETYKMRLQTGLSYLEFSYQLLQAYDFLILARKHQCLLQLGGNDQWSNIIAGIELNRRVDNRAVYGLTLPLCTTSDGRKMGKSEHGAIWLAAHKTSPYDYYQFWINTSDADVKQFLQWFTLLPTDEIETIKTLQGVQLNAAKTILAFEATQLWHGEEEAIKAHQAASSAFGTRQLAKDLLPSSTVPRHPATNTTAVPEIDLAAVFAATDEVVEVVKVLVWAKLAASNNAARRLLTQGGVRLNNQLIDDVKTQISKQSLQVDGLILQVGKKKIIRLVFKSKKH